MDKQKLNKLAWYHNHKDEIIIDKEARAVSQRKWYLKNREKILKEKKEKYVLHPRKPQYKKYKKDLNKMDRIVNQAKTRFNKDLLFIKKSNII